MPHIVPILRITPSVNVKKERKGIAFPVGLHAAWNFGQWIFGFKNVPGIWEAIVEKGYGPEVMNITREIRDFEEKGILENQKSSL